MNARSDANARFNAQLYQQDQNDQWNRAMGLGSYNLAQAQNPAAVTARVKAVELRAKLDWLRKYEQKVDDRPGKRAGRQSARRYRQIQNHGQ